MSYEILFYSPDRHLSYDATTPDREGVGGGLTARIRLAQALAGMGQRVTMLSNVTHAHRHRGVQYLPLSESGTPRQVDVLVMTSSGDTLSLEAARDLPVQARLREVWALGASPIQELPAARADVIVSVSNAIRDVVREEWTLSGEDMFVVHNGFTRYPPRKGLFSRPVERDPYRLVYTSHPSKGLSAALQILRLLRERDGRFSLHIYGGHQLWGGQDQPPDPEPGVIYHGLVGQQELARGLRQSGFSLHLQDILEGFSLALVEAMAYGCIPIVSPVGGNREAVQDGYDGFWVPGDHQEGQVHQRAAHLIHSVAQQPDFAAYLRQNARNVPWSWERQARVWLQHWRWEIEGPENDRLLPGRSCPACGGKWMPAADGYHCLDCGRYALYDR